MTERKTTIVTGGSRGIGRAVVEALLEEGFAVHFCSRTAESVASADEELSHTYGERVHGRQLDIRVESEVEEWIGDVVDRSGRLDVLVNNAGLGVFGAVDEIDAEDWRTVIDTNLTGAFYCIRHAVPVMKRQGEGWIFNIASLAAKNPFAGGAAYNASKFGLLGLSDAAMLDLRHDGVRVVAILPGSVATDFHTRREPDSEWMLGADDIARTVVDLMRYPGRALPSRVEIRPSRPPK